MSTEATDSCRITADSKGLERFTLISQDKSSPKTIMFWIMENIETAPIEKLTEAFMCALKMRNFPNRKLAD